jgi:hypothetical protein
MQIFLQSHLILNGKTWSSRLYKIPSSITSVAKKLERVPVKISVTLEFDRPEFPMLATRLAMAKKMSLEHYYAKNNSGNGLSVVLWRPH